MYKSDYVNLLTATVKIYELSAVEVLYIFCELMDAKEMYLAKNAHYREAQFCHEGHNYLSGILERNNLKNNDIFDTEYFKDLQEIINTLKAASSIWLVDMFISVKDMIGDTIIKQALEETIGY